MFTHLKSNQVLQGVIIMIMACFCFALLNCAIRNVSYKFNPYVMASYRSMFCIMLVAPFVLYVNKRQRADKFSKLNFFKGTIDLISLPIWTMAISNMKIAHAVAISFTTPLISAVLAIIFLKDYLSRSKWAALMVGFTGAYIAVDPSASGDFNMYALYVLGVCALWATANVMTKSLATDKQHPVYIVLYSNIVIFCLSLPFLFESGRMLTFSEILDYIFLSGLACVGHFCLAWSYTKTKMSNLLPLDYTRLLFATMFGITIYGESVHLNTLIGTAIILACSIYIAKKSGTNNDPKTLRST
ncbi:MAG: DMT family transporter [Rickettsiales bacterium]